MTNKTLRSIISVFIWICFLPTIHAQEDKDLFPKESEFKEPITKFWFNTYGNIRISKRLFWVAQTHFRFEETPETPFIGQISQLYNRHAIGYIHSKNFNFSIGGVLRLNFDTNPSSVDRQLVPEWRIWHQYLFASPISSAMFYHRIRIEHRWTQGFAENSSWRYRNRWRYMFKVKIPLNNNKLKAKTLYFSPEAELIMQSGKSVIGSPLEDLRLHGSFGYIITPRLTVAVGGMYSQGQTLSDPGIFKQNWIVRAHLYFVTDFRKIRDKLPAIHLDD